MSRTAQVGRPARKLVARVAALALAAVLLPAGVAAPGSAGSPDAATLARAEQQDFGVPPIDRLHDGAMHGPTPLRIPGAQTITTQQLLALAQARQVPFVVIDVLGAGEALPNAASAAWLAQPGRFDDEVQRQAQGFLQQLTQGRNDVALVFYCLSTQCWMSYNAALRAVHAGYRSVYWYRGGLEAWKAAGLPTQPAMAGRSPGPQWAQQSSSQWSQQPAVPQAGAQPYAGPGRPDPRGGPGGMAAFTPVQPRAPGAPAGEPASLSIMRTRYFSFALPAGWRVAEEGPYAVVLVAPDNHGMTIVVGNAGMMLNESPAAYVQRRIAGMGVSNLAIGNARPAPPAPGLGEAWSFDVRYVSGRGVPVQGVAKVSQSTSYDSKLMVMTAAFGSVDQWPGYARWLPLVAEQISAVDGAAFGRRGVMAQNLQNSTAYGQALREYRAWSQQNWQGVTDARNASTDRRNAEFRENLGAVQTWGNPFGQGPAVELPTTHSYYWMNRQGQLVGTDDPRADPNAGSTGDWRRMERVRR